MQFLRIYSFGNVMECFMHFKIMQQNGFILMFSLKMFSY